MLTDIREVDDAEINAFLEARGIQPFRGRQIREWLWKNGVTDFDRMSNLPASLREALKEHFSLAGLSIQKEQISRDKTRKFAFQCPDGLLVEGVLIPSQGRVTACLSSQVGCPLNCSFCATARLKPRRNLSAGEIFDQVVLLQDASQQSFGTHTTVSCLPYLT
jgi:23S rRNA (adenine2503-C2)-methyltransferase